MNLAAEMKRIDEMRATPEGRAQLEREAAAEREQALAEERAERQRELATLRASHFADCGTPQRVRSVLDAGGLIETPPVLRAGRWIEELPAGWCLVLSADKGAGKSVAAGWWLREMIGRMTQLGWHTTRWRTGAELSRLDWYDGSFANAAEISGPLVIDDLGAEFNDARGFLQQKLDALVDARYRENLPTLITTNLSTKDFRARYGERISDRLREGGTFFEFQAQSMRGRRE